MSEKREIIETSFHLGLDNEFFKDSFILDESFSNVNEESEKLEKNDIFAQLPKDTWEQLSIHRGITKLFDWQEKIIKLPCIYEGGNLIYSSPTGAGKTLISELILMREVLTNNKNAIYVVPYISLAHEKVSSLAPLGCSLGFHVEEYASSKGTIPPRRRYKRRSIYVATIEKAAMILNSLLEEGTADSLGVVVVDEIHMISEPRRGIILETFLAKIIYHKLPIQIVGMSATLRNVDDLCSFLNASYFSTSKRPISLKEYIAIEDEIFQVNSHTSDWNSTLKFHRRFEKSDKNLPKSIELLVNLITELNGSMPCLIFCPTKRNCEIVCEALAKNLSVTDIKKNSRIELISSLEFVTGGVCNIIRRSILKGVAYHHAGMTDDERKIIEEAYLCGTIYVLCCTSTLAAGVNLPAFRVIIKSLNIGIDVLSNTYYRQMIGRAGRPGLSEAGESILMIEKKDEKRLGQVFSCEHVCLSAISLISDEEFSTIILSLIDSKPTTNKNSIIEFFKKTLFFVQLESSKENEDILKIIDRALAILLNKNLIEVDDSSQSIKLTFTGIGVKNSGIEVKAFETIHQDLICALNNLFLASDLHLIYICIPNETQYNCFEYRFLIRMISSLTEFELKLMERTGLSEAMIYKFSYSGSCSALTPEIKRLINRWYQAFLLYQLYKGRTLWAISNQFEISRGILQAIVSNAVGNACSLSRLTKEIKEFWHISILLEEMIKKLSLCHSAEIVPLLEISGVKSARARQLYRAGFTTIVDVASAQIQNLLNIIPHLSRKQAAQIISSAKEFLLFLLLALGS